MKSVLLDTSFLIRLLNEKDPLHKNAMGYWEYYIRERYNLFISTIAVAEFCVKGSFASLPIAYAQLLPFNHIHGQKAGQLAEIVFRIKASRGATFTTRLIVPNDTKMFAQADVEQFDSFVSADSEAKKVYDLIQIEHAMYCNFVDIHIPYNETYMEIDFPQE